MKEYLLLVLSVPMLGGVASGQTKAKLTGTFLYADGTPLDGRVVMILSQPARVAGTEEVVPVVHTFDVVGGVLEPGAEVNRNDRLVPESTTYQVRVVDASLKSLLDWKVVVEADWVDISPPIRIVRPVPAKPKKRRVADWKFWLVLGANVAGTVADSESTAYFVRKCPTCVERNTWLYGRRPTRKRLYLVSAGIVGGTTVMSYYLKSVLEPEGDVFWAWSLPSNTITTMRFVAAKHNVSVTKQWLRQNTCPANGAACRQ